MAFAPQVSGWVSLVVWGLVAPSLLHTASTYVYSTYCASVYYPFNVLFGVTSVSYPCQLVWYVTAHTWTALQHWYVWLTAAVVGMQIQQRVRKDPL